MKALRDAFWVLALHVECSGWTPATRAALDDCWAKCACWLGDRS